MQALTPGDDMAERHTPRVLDPRMLPGSATVFLARLTNSPEAVHYEVMLLRLSTLQVSPGSSMESIQW